MIHPNGTRFYVSNSNDTTVSVIDIPSLTVLDIIPDVGSYPFDWHLVRNARKKCFS